MASTLSNQTKRNTLVRFVCLFWATFSPNFFLIIFDSRANNEENVTETFLSSSSFVLDPTFCFPYHAWIMTNLSSVSVGIVRYSCCTHCYSSAKFQLIFARETNVRLFVVFLSETVLFFVLVLVCWRWCRIWRMPKNLHCVAHNVVIPECLCVCALHWNASNMTQRLLIIIEGRNAAAQLNNSTNEVVTKNTMEILQVKRGHRFKSLSIRMIGWSRHFSVLCGATARSLQNERQKNGRNKRSN